MSTLSFLDPSMVVQSAISSFNNSAIVTPTFVWFTLLMLPLFALVYFCGNDFINRIKWKKLNSPKTRTSNFALCVEVSIFGWLIFMHGNYSVLRDYTSILPFVISGVLFLITASIVQKIKAINPPSPEFFQKIKRKKLFILSGFLIIVAIAGISGMPTFYNAIMQAAAVLCGALVGRAWKRGTNPLFFTSFIIFVISTMLLMQPEFFRFGQLGNLTILHKLFILLTSILALAIMIIRNAKPRGKIHKSAFIKLKWMMRIAAGICLILFILTESVPVFLGLVGVLFVSFVMSVWHAESISERLSKKMWAALLCSFGIMTMMPVITAFGILYWINLPPVNVIKQSKFLL